MRKSDHCTQRVWCILPSISSTNQQNQWSLNMFDSMKLLSTDYFLYSLCMYGDTLCMTIAFYCSMWAKPKTQTQTEGEREEISKNSSQCPVESWQGDGLPCFHTESSRLRKNDKRTLGRHCHVLSKTGCHLRPAVLGSVVQSSCYTKLHEATNISELSMISMFILECDLESLSNFKDSIWKMWFMWYGIVRCKVIIVP